MSKLGLLTTSIKACKEAIATGVAVEKKVKKSTGRPKKAPARKVSDGDIIGDLVAKADAKPKKARKPKMTAEEKAAAKLLKEQAKAEKKAAAAALKEEAKAAKKLAAEEAKAQKKALKDAIKAEKAEKKRLEKEAKELKKSLGVGGAYKNDYIEVHGEKLDKVKQLLEKKCIRFKQTGG